MTDGQWESMNHDGPDGAGDQFYDIPNTPMWGEIGTEYEGRWSWTIIGRSKDGENIEFDGGVVDSEAQAKLRVESWQPRSAKVRREWDGQGWRVVGFDAAQWGDDWCETLSVATFAEAIKLADAWVNYRIERLTEELAA